MKRLVIELDDKKHQEIKKMALNENKSMRKKLLELINEWLNKRLHDKAPICDYCGLEGFPQTLSQSNKKGK